MRLFGSRTGVGAVGAIASMVLSRNEVNLLSSEQVSFFKDEGYLFLPGVFDGEELESFLEAGESAYKLAQRSGFNTFNVIEKGIMFDLIAKNEHASTDLTFERSSIVKEFRKVAIRSKLGQICAELMELDPESQNVRVLRDVFLTKPVNTEEKCDWHVDDQSFWPASYDYKASERLGKDQDGINVWIAMDDMPAAYEGSMCVAPGSHTADWRFDAYRAIGQDRTRTNGPTKKEFLENFRNGGFVNGTCNMHVSDPTLRQRIEDDKVIFDFKKGDVVFATRMLFHRTLSVTPEGREHYNSIGKDALHRYSLRYVPGSTQLPTGLSFEYSILNDSKNRGRTLDDVVAKDNVWYPKVWPEVDLDLDEAMDAIAESILPATQAVAERESQAFFSMLQAELQRPKEPAETNTAR